MSKPKFCSLGSEQGVEFESLQVGETFTDEADDAITNLRQKTDERDRDELIISVDLESGCTFAYESKAIVYRRHIKIVEITEAESNANA